MTVVGNFDRTMKVPLYIFITVLLFGCKSIPIEKEHIDKRTEIDFYETGFIKSIGLIDSNDFSKAARIGLWTEFYDNGKLKETGEYKNSTYVNCCIAGPCDITYSYKVGEWKYFHENGQLKAQGVYKIDKKHIDTTCEGGDEIYVGYLNAGWEFYNKDGTQMTPTDKEIKEIEESGIIDEFDLLRK